MNHDKFPSMQMNQKSKHSNSGFKKWMQILAGEELLWSKNRTPNWNSATKKKTTAGNLAAERKSLCPAKKKPSPRGRGDAIATTDMSRQLQLRHFFAAFVLNSISLWMHRDKIPQLQCQRSRWRDGIADPSCRRFEKMPSIGFASKATSRGSAFLEVCSQHSGYVPRCKDRQQELHDL